MHFNSSLGQLAKITFFPDYYYNLPGIKGLWGFFFFLPEGKARSLAFFWLGFTYVLSLSHNVELDGTCSSLKIHF